MTVRWKQLGLPADTRASVRDLYAEKDLGEYVGAFTAAAVGAHDVVALRITPLASGAGTATAGGVEDSWRPWNELHGPIQPPRLHTLLTDANFKQIAAIVLAVAAAGGAVALAAASWKRGSGGWRRLDRGSGGQGSLD